MQYIQQNKVNYLSDSNALTYVDTLTNQTHDFIVYSGDKLYNYVYGWNDTKTATGTSFTILNRAIDHTANDIVYSLRPSFTCSDFINITSNDSITFRITTDTESHTYTYPLNQQYMNAPQLIGVVHKSKKLVVTATSTIRLTMVQVPKLGGNYVNNCDVVFM